MLASVSSAFFGVGAHRTINFDFVGKLQKLKKSFLRSEQYLSSTRACCFMVNTTKVFKKWCTKFSKLCHCVCGWEEGCLTISSCYCEQIDFIYHSFVFSFVMKRLSVCLSLFVSYFCPSIHFCSFYLVVFVLESWFQPCFFLFYEFCCLICVFFLSA